MLSARTHAHTPTHRERVACIACTLAQICFHWPTWLGQRLIRTPMYHSRRYSYIGKFVCSSSFTYIMTLLRRNFVHTWYVASPVYYLCNTLGCALVYLPFSFCCCCQWHNDGNNITADQYCISQVHTHIHTHAQIKSIYPICTCVCLCGCVIANWKARVKANSINRAFGGDVIDYAKG